MGLPPPEEIVTAPLGDFRIVREVGRGGMGILYEAEQMSLGRRVALKVLPFAATMDPRHLQRFQNEARAAASLEHPHIVPVYGVGCERGVHYYAMKFIDGQSLAAVIDEWKKAKETNHRGTENTEKRQQTVVSSLCSLCLYGSDDFFKTVAEWGTQAAEALEHAHGVGIVHRDVKPANLMIDSQGRLWVTDFGLARTAADAGLTMTGDVLGTLRYMSPEQALAKHGLVDHRTDVYSLGVTLYELLTRTPAVGGKDREQILNAITLDEPRPPRALDAMIPQDLETILLKAIAKNAAERYVTAKEMAEDFKRFLSDKPISARPPSLLKKAAKWSRRHKSIMYAAAACLVIALIVLAIATFVIVGERNEAVRQRDLAREQRRLARQAVDDMYMDVAEKWLADSPNLDDIQRRFLEKALSYYQKFVRNGEADDPQERFENAKAYTRIGKLLIMGHGDKKEVVRDAVEQAISILQALWHEFPEEPKYGRELADAYMMLGWMKDYDLIQNENAQKKCVAIWEQLVTRYPEPDNRCSLSRALWNLSHPVESLRPHEAEWLRRRSVSILEQLILENPRNALYSIRFAYAATYLGESLVEFGRWTEAEEYFHRAIAAWQANYSARAGGSDYRHGLEAYSHHYFGKVYIYLGNLLRRVQRYDEAEHALREALRIHQQLASDFPTFSHYIGELFRESKDMGTLLLASGKGHEAKLSYGQALEIGDKMVADFPDDGGAQRGMAWFLITCPILDFRNPSRAVELSHKALKSLPDAQTWEILNDRARLASWQIRPLCSGAWVPW
jgi:serine/threonine protein kinase